MINKILDTLDAKKEKSILIGDSKKDSQAATAAGIDSILVNWGFSDHNDEAIDNVSELTDMLIAN